MLGVCVHTNMPLLDSNSLASSKISPEETKEIVLFLVLYLVQRGKAPLRVSFQFSRGTPQEMVCGSLCKSEVFL